MYSFLVIIEIIASILLVITVLLQASKGDGLAGTFGGGGNMGSMFGTRRTADFLSKATWWIGGFVLGLAVVINLFFLPGSTSSSERQSIIQGIQQQQAVPTTPALPPALGDEQATPPPSTTNEEQK